MGTWATDKVFAKCFGNEIRGFRLGGSEASETAWRRTLPGSLCAVTRHAGVDGRTAIAYAGNGTGEGAGADGRPDGDPLTRPATGSRCSTWGEGSAAYELTGGKRLWADSDPSACADEGFAGGPDLLALLSRGDSADPAYRVQKIDPRTGDAVWTYRVARGVQGVYLVSSSPAVIAVAAGDVVVTDLISLDERGKRRATIRLNRDYQVLDCDRTFSAVVESCGAIVVGDEQLYLSEEDHVVAHDLATGRTAGESGDETLLLLFAGGAEVGALDDPAHNDIVYEHGRVFFAARTVVGPYNDGEVRGTDQVAVGIESAG
ncbi:hypothetical protein [Streptomyces coelicoflavus]|uniref:hypothetical protein n=1 Tax=Streptomyces coelicoflavus TaxID=285562 RepID=UPI00362F9118